MIRPFHEGIIVASRQLVLLLLLLQLLLLLEMLSVRDAGGCKRSSGVGAGLVSECHVCPAAATTATFSECIGNESCPTMQPNLPMTTSNSVAVFSSSSSSSSKPYVAFCCPATVTRLSPSSTSVAQIKVIAAVAN